MLQNITPTIDKSFEQDWISRMLKRQEQQRLADLEAKWREQMENQIAEQGQSEYQEWQALVDKQSHEREAQTWYVNLDPNTREGFDNSSYVIPDCTGMGNSDASCELV